MRSCASTLLILVCAIVATSAHAVTPQQECDAAELKAVAKQIKASLRCRARHVRRHADDPGGVELDQCRDASAAVFDEAVRDAKEKATEAGWNCSSNLALLDVEALAADATAAIEDGLLFGWSPLVDDSNDDKLRARLLKAAAKLARRSVGAEAKYRLDPDPALLQARQVKAEIKFEARAAKHLDRAEDHDVPFAEFTSTIELRIEILALLQELVAAMIAEADPI